MNVQTYSAGFVNRARGAMARQDTDLETLAAGAGAGMALALVSLALLFILSGDE